MNLYPNLKITPNEWISQKLKYSDITMNELLNDIFYNLLYYIDNNEDIDRFIEDNDAYFKFIEFIYKKYNAPYQKYKYDFEKDELYKHYNYTYGNEITELFLYLKELTRSQNSDLFHKKRDTCIDLIDFIYSICDYNDPYIDDEIEENHTDEIYEVHWAKLLEF